MLEWRLLVRVEELGPAHVHVNRLRLGAVFGYPAQPAGPVLTPFSENAVTSLRVCA